MVASGRVFGFRVGASVERPFRPGVVRAVRLIGAVVDVVSRPRSVVSPRSRPVVSRSPPPRVVARDNSVVVLPRSSKVVVVPPSRVARGSVVVWGTVGRPVTNGLSVVAPGVVVPH